MIEIKEKKDCCGCFACSDVCPKSCITMEEDNEGFWYPVVDKDICIDCHLCEKVCPILNATAPEKEKQCGYLLQNKDERVLKESTSGGAFSAIGAYVINRGGVVFGATMNENNEAVHRYVDKIEDLRLFRNSKYVQSIIGDTYKQALAFLKEGRLVCFSGTPCQMEGLLRFLRKPYDNLIAVDVVCRAVPSPKVLRKYIEYRKEEFGGQISNLKFRDKSFYGYKYSNMSFNHPSGVYHNGIDTDPWLRSFFSGINVRPSCFDCKFKSRYRKTDITIWDCFDVSKFSREMDNDKGVTRILTHTEKGFKVLSELGDYANIMGYDPDSLVEGVVQMQRPQEMSPLRDAFFADIDTLSATQLFEKYFPVTIRNRLEKNIRIFMLRLGLYKKLRAVVKAVVGEVKR